MRLGVKIYVYLLVYFVVEFSFGLLSLFVSNWFLIAFVLFFLYMVMYSGKLECPRCSQKIFGFSWTGGPNNPSFFIPPSKCRKCGCPFFS